MITLFFAYSVCSFLFSTNYIYFAIPIAAVTIIILLLPVEGFSKKEFVEQVKLIELRRYDSKNTTFYIEQKRKKIIFAYDNKAEFDLKGTAYEEKCIKGKIKIYEAKDCTLPVIKKYVQKPCRGLFTFAPFSTKTQYVVHVPEGTVYNAKMRKNDYLKSTRPKNGNLAECEEIV